MTYAEFLQTISTLTGLTGVGCVLYATFVAKRVHGAITDQTSDLKKSIQKQTDELKNGR